MVFKFIELRFIANTRQYLLPYGSNQLYAMILNQAPKFIDSSI